MISSELEMGAVCFGNRSPRLRGTWFSWEIWRSVVQLLSRGEVDSRGGLWKMRQIGVCQKEQEFHSVGSGTTDILDLIILCFSLGAHAEQCRIFSSNPVPPPPRCQSTPPLTPSWQCKYPLVSHPQSTILSWAYGQFKNSRLFSLLSHFHCCSVSFYF